MINDQEKGIFIMGLSLVSGNSNGCNNTIFVEFQGCEASFCLTEGGIPRVGESDKSKNSSRGLFKKVNKINILNQTSLPLLDFLWC